MLNHTRTTCAFTKTARKVSSRIAVICIEPFRFYNRCDLQLDVMELRTREMENTLNAHEEENSNVVEFTRLLEAELQELERQKVTVEAELDLTKRKVRSCACSNPDLKVTKKGQK